MGQTACRDPPRGGVRFATMPARSSAPARSRECHAARVLQIVTGADLVLGVATGLLVGVALAVNFREVVHSVRTGNADVAKP